MRKALLVRFLICIAAGVLIAIPMSELAFLSQGNTTSRPAKTIVLDIPAGTSARVAEGTSVIPQEMLFVLGDRLVVNNLDSVAHTLGPLFIPPGGSASLALKQTGNLSYVCSFQPTKIGGSDGLGGSDPVHAAAGGFYRRDSVGNIVWPIQPDLAAVEKTGRPMRHKT